MITVKRSGYAMAGLTLALAFSLPAQADEAAFAARPASVSTERLNSAQLEARGARAARSAALLQTVAAIDAYQQRVGALGFTLASNFSVKRLGQAMRDDHGRLSDVLNAALAEEDLSVDPNAALPSDLSARFDSLLQVDADDFDAVFLASQIRTSQQALKQLDSYAPADLDPMTREAVAMASELLEKRIVQARTLQAQLEG
jgi:predicted outer membrane protein